MNMNLDILDDEVGGGPAFPCGEIRTHDTNDIVQNADQGVSKRDWFAARMEITLSRRTAGALMGSEPPSGDALAEMQWWARAEAKYRYLKADAMMGARK
jgi:hypothetical protein